MINNNEIHLKRLWIIVKSRGGMRSTETSILVDPAIAETLLNRGKLTDIESIQFHQYIDKKPER